MENLCLSVMDVALRTPLNFVSQWSQYGHEVSEYGPPVSLVSMFWWLLESEIKMKCGEVIVPTYRDITIPLLHDW